MLGSSGDVTDGVRAGGSGSDRELAGQLGDAVLDLLERGVERGIGANPHRVRDRPVQMGEPAELFVREVAHRHDQVTLSDYVVEVSWADARKGQPLPMCYLGGGGVDALGGVCPRRDRRDRARLAPQGRAR